MEITPREREVIVQLAEIKADPNAKPETPSVKEAAEADELNRETTKLLRKANRSYQAKPAGG